LTRAGLTALNEVISKKRAAVDMRLADPSRFGRRSDWNRIRARRRGD
jgi:hypothetical protein